MSTAIQFDAVGFAPEIDSNADLDLDRGASATGCQMMVHTAFEAFLILAREHAFEGKVDLEILDRMGCAVGGRKLQGVFDSISRRCQENCRQEGAKPISARIADSSNVRWVTDGDPPLAVDFPCET